MRTSTLMLLTLILLPAAALADADRCTKERVDRVMNSTVAVYDSKGAYLKDIPARLIKIGANVLDCKESPAHVRVGLTAGEPVWVDRLDLGITSGETPAKRQCKASGISRPHDQTTPATSGIDPCGS